MIEIIIISILILLFWFLIRALSIRKMFGNSLISNEEKSDGLTSSFILVINAPVKTKEQQIKTVKTIVTKLGALGGKNTVSLSKTDILQFGNKTIDEAKYEMHKSNFNKLDNSHEHTKASYIAVLNKENNDIKPDKNIISLNLNLTKLFHLLSKFTVTIFLLIFLRDYFLLEQ